MNISEQNVKVIKKGMDEIKMSENIKVGKNG